MSAAAAGLLQRKAWHDGALLLECGHQPDFARARKSRSRRFSLRGHVYIGERPGIVRCRTGPRLHQPERSSLLIYDVGMHNGDDTEYYLLKGADVVGIEANPALLPGLRRRFADEISARRLTLVDKAVGPEEKPVPFYVDPGKARQSSMVRNRAGFSEIEVQAVRLSSLMQVYGSPAFAKIDVESMDGAVLDDLNSSGVVPPHLSVEAHTFDIFFRLYAMGFTQFRLINCRRVRDLFKNHPVSTLDGTVVSHDFPHHSSGPFGDDLPQPWQTLEQVCAQRISRESLSGRGWYDVHATSRQTSSSPANGQETASGVARWLTGPLERSQCGRDGRGRTSPPSRLRRPRSRTAWSTQSGRRRPRRRRERRSQAGCPRSLPRR